MGYREIWVTHWSWCHSVYCMQDCHVGTYKDFLLFRHRVVHRNSMLCHNHTQTSVNFLTFLIL